MDDSLWITARSRDDQLVAIAASSSSRIGLYQTDTGHLQTTLTCRRGSISKLLFMSSSHHLAALTTENRIVVFDVTRGVVAYTVPNDSHHRDVQILDMAVTTKDPSESNEWYGLVKSGHKWQVWALDTNTGKLVRKIKAGKVSAAAASLAVTDHYCLVQTVGMLRVLDSSTGKKVHKMSLDESTTACVPMTVLQDHVAITRQSQTVAVLSLSSGETVATTAVHQPITSLQTVGSDGLIVNETFVYQLTNGQLSLLATLNLVEDTIDYGTILGGHTEHLLTCLYKGGAWQLGPLPANANAQISWKSPPQEETPAQSSSNKRKAVVLGPTQAGQQAQALEGRKAQRTKEATLDDVEEEEDDNSPTISQRLAQLQKAMDDEEEKDEESPTAVEPETTSFSPKKATTASLSALLQQALQSRDDALLELALQVHSRPILQETCQALTPNQANILLTALTTRLATKPARAEQLCLWLSCLLSSGKIQSIPHLQPLQNLIKERLEVFPALLQLDGRLSMMNT